VNVVTNVETEIVNKNKLTIRAASKVPKHGTIGGQNWSSIPNIVQFTKKCSLNILNVINCVHLMSLLHVSATHGPSSGNIYYLGNHCTVHFVLSIIRHIVVVNLLCRIFSTIFFAAVSVFF
jgi:hypothetical protein